MKGSKSVKALQEVLQEEGYNVKRLKINDDGSLKSYRYRDDDIIINWGNSVDNTPKPFTINPQELVAVAVDKLKTFELFDGLVPIPRFTTDKQEALSWGTNVYARTKLRGHSGDGIIYYESGTGDLIDAPLYTEAVQNDGEYRVHIFKREVILYQKKSRRRNDDGEVDTPNQDDSRIRNLASGWVYRTGYLTPMEDVVNLAKDAVMTLGLDFGVVDIIRSDNDEQRFKVLEVNTAPGLGNTRTLEAYRRAFTELFSGQDITPYDVSEEIADDLTELIERRDEMINSIASVPTGDWFTGTITTSTQPERGIEQIRAEVIDTMEDIIYEVEGRFQVLLEKLDNQDE